MRRFFKLFDKRESEKKNIKMFSSFIWFGRKRERKEKNTFIKWQK